MAKSPTPFTTASPAVFGMMVELLDEDAVNLGGTLPPEGTKYQDFPDGVLQSSWADQWGTALYIGQGPKTPTGIMLMFLPSLTQAQRDKAYRVIPSKDNHYWHPLLRALEILQTPHAPRSYPGTQTIGSSTNPVTFSGPSFFVRQDYVPAATEGTLFIRSYYFGDIPFQVAQTPCPQPSSVSYDFPGCRGNFPECLHDEIIIKAMNIVTNAVDVGGTATATPAGLGGQFFPATNFTGRVAYLLYSRQHFEGGYNLETALVIPPPEPEVSVR